MLDGGLLWAGQDPAVTQEKDETIDMEDKSKGGGPIPPSNHSFKVKEQERKDYHAWKGYFNIVTPPFRSRRR